MSKKKQWLIAVAPLVIFVVMSVMVNSLINRVDCAGNVAYTGDGMVASFSMPPQCRILYGLAPILSSVAFISFIWLPFGLTRANPKLYWTKYVVVAFVIFIVFIGFGGVFFTTNRCPRGHCASGDIRRISDFRQIQNLLEIYFSKCGIYPGNHTVPGSAPECSGVLDPYGIVGTAWDIARIPEDPLTQKKYEYAPNSDQTSYVLRGVLIDASNAVLDYSATGTIYGLDCNPPAYCVTYSHAE